MKMMWTSYSKYQYVYLYMLVPIPIPIAMYISIFKNCILIRV